MVFDSSLKAEASNEQRATAVLVAESAFNEIRSAANNDFRNLKTNFDGKTWTIAPYTEFQITAKIDNHRLPIPCTELESPYPVAPAFPIPERRLLDDSIWRCEVSINWSRSAGEDIRLVRYMSNLSKIKSFQIKISPSGSTKIDDNTSGTLNVGRAMTLDLKVSASADGEPVRDITYTWYVEPLNGFGSINRVSRSGDTCRYKNSYRNYDGNTKFSPGLCDVVVRAVYQGTEAKRKVRVRNG